jgi:hypothetical protein
VCKSIVDLFNHICCERIQKLNGLAVFQNSQCTSATFVALVPLWIAAPSIEDARSPQYFITCRTLTRMALLHLMVAAGCSPDLEGRLCFCAVFCYLPYMGLSIVNIVNLTIQP